MRTTIACLALALTLASCTSCRDGAAAQSPEAQLVSEMKQVLSERDKRLASYHLAATSKEGEAAASHELFYRAPNRSRGVMLAPEALTVAFDGTKLYRLTPAAKKLEVFELKLPVDKASFFLASTFTPFVPEGFRAPLLPQKGVTAKKVAHPKGPDAVELTVATRDEAAGDISVTYVPRFPTGDFLGKRTTAGGRTAETVVDEEHCDTALKLCVPKALRSLEDGKVVHSTTLTTVELNPELPNDSFTLVAPEGFATEPHEVVETGK